MPESSSLGVAVITGGAAGLGQAYAVRLAHDGWDVAVADLAPAPETQAAVEAQGRRYVEGRCDVSDVASAQRFADAVLESLGAATVLVNNAGIYQWTTFEETTPELWARTLAVNLTGPFNMVRAFLPHMKSVGRGKIVNVASSTVYINVPLVSSYMASKMGVIGLTRALATELGPYRINANVLAPGLVATETMRGVDEAIFEALPKMQPLSKALEPQDLVGAVSFLCSRDSDFMTAQTMVVDGGLARI